MDSRLKQRLIGAAVLVALAVIFLPLLVQGPAPDSGVSDVPLSMPEMPKGDYQTRDLPLVTPGDMPDGGAVGLDSAAPAAPQGSPPTAGATAPASEPATAPSGNDGGAAGNAGTPAQPDSAAQDPMFPAPSAAGDYAVSFGAYATAAAAEAVVGSLRASQLPGYREAATIGGKPAQRVRIGPYATRADAEAARLRAAHVRDDVGARVIVLDADVEPSAQGAPAAPIPPAASTKPAPAPVTSKPAATTAPAGAPSPPAAGSTGFAVQLAAYSKATDADSLRDKLRAAGFSAFTETVQTDKGALTRVRAGPVVTRTDAEQLKAQIQAKLGLDGVVRPHP